MRKAIIIGAIAALVIFSIYWSWRLWPQDDLVAPGHEPVQIIDDRDSVCQYLLITVQAEVSPYYYRDQETFTAMLDRHLHPIRDQLSKADDKLIVFPEHIGSWLVASHERNSVYTAESTLQAMTQVIMSHPINYKTFRFTVLDAQDDNQAALFHMKAQDMATIYQESFSHMAQKYNAHIVAGSLFLPDPIIEDGKIVPRLSPLYNVSFLFYPDGTVDPHITAKAYPIDSEKAICSAKPVDDYLFYDTPFGKLATIICADAWYPETYEWLRNNHVDIMAVPSYSIGHDLMDQPWQGYNGADMPADVDASDIGKITEGQAWIKYGPVGRTQSDSMTILHAYLRGDLWDMVSDGQTMTVDRAGRHPTSSDHGSVIVTCLN